MYATTFSNARKRLNALMDRVVDDCDPVTVTRQHGDAVVMVSQSDWNAIQQKLYRHAVPDNSKADMQVLEIAKSRFHY